MKNLTRIALSLIVFILLTLAVSSPVHAATNWYVSVGGNGDCSQAAPCGDINTAYQKANQGDIIEVAGGTYSNQTISYRSAAGTWTTNVVVRPASGASVQLGSLNLQAARITLRSLTFQGAGVDSNAKYSRFEDITIQGSTFIVGTDNFYIGKSNLGPQDGNDSLRIDPDSTGHSPDRIIVEDNVILAGRKTGADQHLDAFQTLGATNLVFQRNIVRASTENAAVQIGDLPPTANVLFQNNIIQVCSPTLGCGYAAISDASAGVRYISNTIQGGIYPGPAIYTGNIIDNPGGYMVCDINRQYNLINTGPNSSCGGTNHILHDATLNYAGDGWHLVSSNPAVNLGVVGGATTDYDGETRDSQPDAGADEFGGAIDPTSTPIPPAPTTAPCPTLPTDKGTANLTFNITTPGTYKVWSRINAPDSSNNSYLLDIDNSLCGVNVGDSAIAPNTWTWVDSKDGNAGSKIDVTLTAGTHTLKMAGRELGVKLDRIILLNDGCAPSGNGDNCIATGITPTVTPTSHTDDFTSSTLNPAWTFVDPVGNSTQSLSTNPGHLQITLPSGITHDCWSNGQTCTRMMRNTSNVDATYETKIDGASISQQYQSYGILLWQDSSNFIRFEYGADPNVTIATWKVIGGVGSNAIAKQSTTLGASNYLRVVRGGSTFTLFKSTDGTNWTNVGSLNQPGFTVNQVGLHAGNSVATTTTANFDYFIDSNAIAPTVAPTSTPVPTATPLPTTTPTLTPTLIPPTPTVASADSTSPSVTIVSPSNGAVIARGKTLTITASASDNVGVSKVEFYVNGSLKCTDTTVFYNCNWNVPTKRNVTYTLKAVAYDAAGNSSTSSVTITAK